MKAFSNILGNIRRVSNVLVDLVEDTGAGDNDFLLGASTLGANSLHGLYDFHSFDDFTKDDVLAVQLERRGVSGQCNRRGD